MNKSTSRDLESCAFAICFYRRTSSCKVEVLHMDGRKLGSQAPETLCLLENALTDNYIHTSIMPSRITMMLLSICTSDCAASLGGTKLIFVGVLNATSYVSSCCILLFLLRLPLKRLPWDRTKALMVYPSKYIPDLSDLELTQ